MKKVSNLFVCLCLCLCVYIQSGNEVSIQLLSREETADNLLWGLHCLKECMRYEEEEYDLEYDLHVLSIVCIDGFGGQMANKSLFIFDCEVLAADIETSTGILL